MELGTKYKLQYVSDIHLEMRKNKIPTIEPVEPGNSYLALCGDIGNPYIPSYRNFISIHSKLFVHILIVSGNHEYYTGRSKQMTINTIDQEIQKIVKEFDNVTYLNMNGIIIGRTKFIGCTFWSDVSSILYEAEMVMNDYKNIYVDCPGLPDRYNGEINIWGGSRRKRIKPDRRSLKSTDIVMLHNTMKKWVKCQIDKYDPNNQENKYDNIIVLTHHAPSFLMLNKKNDYSNCYASDCDDLFKNPVIYWISGHTHFCKSIVINDIQSLSNCMGYPGQNVENFNSNNFIELN